MSIQVLWIIFYLGHWKKWAFFVIFTLLTCLMCSSMLGLHIPQLLKGCTFCNETLVINSVSLLRLQQHKWHNYQYWYNLLPVSALSLVFVISDAFVCCYALVSVKISNSVRCSPWWFSSLKTLQTSYSSWCS